MTDHEQRIADLEAQIEFLNIRHTALEWFVENHITTHLLTFGPAVAKEWVDKVSQPNLPAYRLDGGAEVPARPDANSTLRAELSSIGSKILTRVAAWRSEG